jgi:Zn-dependent protease with chaperone function
VATPPPVVRKGSRIREGALTFGITGRVLITILVGLAGAAGVSLFLIPYFTSHSHVALAYAAVFLVPYSVVAWLILRDVWKRSWQPLEVLQERPWRPSGGDP